MQQPKLDLNRLDVLKSIALSEKAAVQTAQDEVCASIERSGMMQKEIQSLNRQIAKAPKDKNLQRRLDGTKAEKEALDRKIEDLHQDVEIARGRSNVAKRLNKRCADYLSGNLEGGL